MASVENPFAKFQPQPINRSGPVAVDDENPFSKFQPQPQQAQPMAPSPDGGLQDDLNRMRDQGKFDTQQLPGQGVVQSQSEIYSPVDSQDKYKPLSDYENSFAYQNGVNFRMVDALDDKKKVTYSLGQGLNPFGGHFGEFQMPPELEALREQRDQERQTQYGNTGEADNIETIAGNIPVRTQQKRENNPAFDPSKPEGPNNPAMISTRYLVDPPTMDTIQRMGYQVLQNIVGGVGDAVTEGKLTGEGAIGKTFPETVPNQTGEKFVDDLATFFIGAKGVDKAAKGLGWAAGGVGGAVAKTAQTLSPEATQAIKTAYETTLKGTGSAIKAKAAANAVTRNMLVGLSFGLKSAKMGLGDAVVAPNDTQGLVSPQWIQKEFGVTRERADDYSVMLDSPVIAGALGTFGKMYGVIKDRVVSPTVGGLRNVNVFGVDAGKIIPLSEKTAGLKLLTTIDPNIHGLAPEDAAFKIRQLADSIQRNGVKNLEIAGAGKQVKLDTPTAFTEVAQDYYRTAYANLKETMGPREFNDWVSEQAHNSSRTLFELRTAISSNDPNAIAATRIMDLFEEGAQKAAGGDLKAAQGKLGQMSEQRQFDRTTGADLMEETAKKEADKALEASRKGISDDPEFKLFMDEADTELGSKSAVGKAVHGNLSEKTYEAVKKLKGDSDAAYKRIADSGAEGDPTTFLETAKQYGDVTKNEAGEDIVTFSDPKLRKWVESVNSDPSFGNMYNSVRNQIKSDIGNELRKGPNANHDRVDMLRDLQNNIEDTQLDYLRSSDSQDVVKMVDDARGAYRKLYDAFKSSDLTKPLYDKGKVRMSGEGQETATGIPRGKTDWDTTFGNTVQQLDGINGPHLREALKKAAEVGGQDISGDLANLYATKLITNITNTASAGGKESVGQLRANMSGIIEGLQGVNSPMVPRLRALEQKLQTLENTALDKGKVYDEVRKQADELRKEASQSILGKFVYKGKSLQPTEVGRELKTIFRSNNSVSKVQDILKEADKAGQGESAREALQGSYLDYFRERIGSRSNLGIGEAGPRGEVRSGFRISETQADKLFDEGGNDLANIKEIFSNKPEIVKSLDEIRDVYTNLSKKTPKVDGDVLGPLNRSEDPEQALQSVVTLVFGPLNRTGSKVRRLTTPLGVESLAQVRNKRAELLNAMMENPDEFSKISQKIAKGIQDKETAAYISKHFGRAVARANSNFLSQEVYGKARETPAIRDEMIDLK